jgi:hypothetical protein
LYSSSEEEEEDDEEDEEEEEDSRAAAFFVFTGGEAADEDSESDEEEEVEELDCLRLVKVGGLPRDGVTAAGGFGADAGNASTLALQESRISRTQGKNKGAHPYTTLL